MKQGNKNWTDDLRKRLSDYEEGIPAGGWERLEEELADPIITGVRHSYRWMAVAAAILLLLASSVCMYFLKSPASDYLEGIREVASAVKGQEQRIPAQTSKPDKPSDEIAQAYGRTVERHPVEKKQAQQEQAGETIEPAQETQGQEQERVEQPQEESAAVVHLPSSDYSDANISNQLFQNRKNRAKSLKLSVGVSVGNSLLASSDVRPGFGRLYKAEGRAAHMQGILPSMGGNSENDYLFLGAANGVSSNPAKAEAYRQVVYNNVDKETSTDVKHYMPLTIGVSFRLPLYRHFAVETGVNYASLSSELRAGGRNSYYMQKQRLHYLGIPVKGTWIFFDKKYLSLYISAGGAIEKCISGELKNTFIVEGKAAGTETSDLNVKPLQWSVTSAVGVQLNLTGHLGIYAEPGISYYFDDGSNVQTIRKEKPFGFNLQLGFRVTY